VHQVEAGRLLDVEEVGLVEAEVDAVLDGDARVLPDEGRQRHLGDRLQHDGEVVHAPEERPGHGDAGGRQAAGDGGVAGERGRQFGQAVEVAAQIDERVETHAV